MANGEETASKVDKETANFRTGTEEQSCAKCINFEPPNGCAVVEGAITAGALSDLFSPKEDAATILPEISGIPNDDFLV